MKVCPQCGREYVDEAQNFCLSDGAPLADGASLPTVAIAGDPTSDPTVVMTHAHVARPTNLEPRRKSRAPLIVGIVVLGVLLVGVSGVLLAMLMKKGEAVSANQDRARTNANSQKLAPSITPDDDASPTPDDRSGVNSDDVTPIAWSTSAGVFDTAAGKRYRFGCPADGIVEMIWGSDVYTSNSSICTAAVHAGKITVKDGGEVEIELRPGRQTYGATTRNGVTSNNFGESASSFVILGGSTPKNLSH